MTKCPNCGCEIYNITEEGKKALSEISEDADDKKEPKIDYWMYIIIDNALKEKYDVLTKKYKNIDDINKFKENRFDKLGQVNLARIKIREIYEYHDEQIKQRLGFWKTSQKQ